MLYLSVMKVTGGLYTRRRWISFSFFGHSGCCVETRLQAPKHKTIVTLTRVVGAKLACAKYDM